jgi:hyperosmotically inducible protein
MNHLKPMTPRGFAGAALVAMLAIGGPAWSGDASKDCAASGTASDGWIDTRLETVYLFNSSLNNFAIDTDVSEGVVTLSGTVQSDIEKDLAGEIAKSLEGVKSVNNELVVGEQPETAQAPATSDGFVQKVTDATTTAMVKARLIANDNVAASDITCAPMSPTPSAKP